MIASFRTAGAEDIYHGRDTDAARAACPPKLWERARRRLDQLGASARLADLGVPPGNRLQPLLGARAGQHGLRVDASYAICFVWTEHGARNVEVADVRQAPAGPSAARLAQPGLAPTGRPPTHPGEMLREELLKPLKITQGELAALSGIRPEAAALLLNGHLDVTSEIASSLERVFALSSEFWRVLQAQWDAHQHGQISWSGAVKAGKREKRARGDAQVIELPVARRGGAGTRGPVARATPRKRKASATEPRPARTSGQAGKAGVKPRPRRVR